MVVGDHRVVSYRKAVAEAMSADQLSRPLLVRQIYQRQDKDERSWSITDGRRKDGSRYSPRVGAGVGGGEGRVPRPGLTRHRLTQSWSRSSFPPRLRSANAVLPSLLEHQRPCPPHRHRRLRRALLRVRQRNRVTERPIPQDLHPQWSRTVSSLCHSLQGSYYCAPESLAPDEIIPPSGTLDQDLDNLATIVEDDVPAYILVRLDEPPSEWVAIYYVPDSAKVRDKVRPMQYAQ